MFLANPPNSLDGVGNMMRTSKNRLEIQVSGIQIILMLKQNQKNELEESRHIRTFDTTCP